jgi:long-subunit fatty acid transport protein
MRYIDYDNTEFFGHATGYNASGAFTGLGWKSVFSVVTGMQYQCSDRLSLRMGYMYAENPIDDADTFFNIASSAIYQHILSFGATWQITCRTGLSIAYLRAFDNSISGPWVDPVLGPLPGVTSVKARQSVDALVMGLQVKF